MMNGGTVNWAGENEVEAGFVWGLGISFILTTLDLWYWTFEWMHEIGNYNSLAFRGEAKAGDTHLIVISAEFLFIEGITQDGIT